MPFDAPDDQAALTHASESIFYDAVEVWCERRLVVASQRQRHGPQTSRSEQILRTEVLLSEA
jgi:hypothetical protein